MTNEGCVLLSQCHHDSPINCEKPTRETGNGNNTILIIYHSWIGRFWIQSFWTLFARQSYYYYYYYFIITTNISAVCQFPSIVAKLIFLLLWRQTHATVAARSTCIHQKRGLTVKITLVLGREQKRDERKKG
jgi:membrane-associated phospholipid phosphatase